MNLLFITSQVSAPLEGIAFLPAEHRSLLDFVTFRARNLSGTCTPGTPGKIWWKNLGFYKTPIFISEVNE